VLCFSPRGGIKGSKLVPGVQRFMLTPLRADPHRVSGYVANYEQGARLLGLSSGSQFRTPADSGRRAVGWPERR